MNICTELVPNSFVWKIHLLVFVFFFPLLSIFPSRGDPVRNFLGFQTIFTTRVRLNDSSSLSSCRHLFTRIDGLTELHLECTCAHHYAGFKKNKIKQTKNHTHTHTKSPEFLKENRQHTLKKHSTVRLCKCRLVWSPAEKQAGSGVEEKTGDRLLQPRWP